MKWTIPIVILLIASAGTIRRVVAIAIIASVSVSVVHIDMLDMK